MSTRLTKHLRQVITNSVIERRFKEEKKQLAAKMTELGREVFDAAVYQVNPGGAVDLNSLPEGWLPEQCYISVRLGDKTTRFNFPEKRRIPYCIEGYSAAKFPVAHKLTRRHEKLVREREAITEKQDKLYAKTLGALSSYTTVEKLVKAWPEIKPYIPVDAAPATTTALAVPIASLNSALRLNAPDSAV